MSMDLNTRIFTRILLCLLCVAMTSHESRAQMRENLDFAKGNGKVPVTVLLAEGEGPPLIFRRISEPMNVIVVNGSTSAAELSTAIFSLLVAEAIDPSGRQRSDNAALRMNMPRATPQYGNAAVAISRLQAARPRRVGSLGEAHRAIDIWVTPRRGHHR